MNISITLRASSGRHFFFLPPQNVGEGRILPAVGRAPQPCKQPSQSTRERWNLQQSFWATLRSEIRDKKSQTTVARHTEIEVPTRLPAVSKSVTGNKHSPQ